MSLSRREFIRLSGSAGLAMAAMGLGFDIRPVKSYAASLDILKAKETTTICPYCAVGCGMIVHTTGDGKILNIEGDPDHPINEGALCAKGAALYQMSVNPSRLELGAGSHRRKGKGNQGCRFYTEKCARKRSQSNDRHCPCGLRRPG